MTIRSVCVIGGSGFLGRQVVGLLAGQGFPVSVPTRSRERAKRMFVLPTADLIEADVHDSRTLETLVADADAVVNLAGILHETRHGDFTGVHVDLPRKIVEACRAKSVRRLVHVSALKASENAASAYLRSKAGGELQIRAAESSAIRTTIFRPSILFGEEDRFLNLFARLAGCLPVLALACPQTRMQPIWVQDVARAVVRCLDLSVSFNASYDLCGPRIYTLRQLVSFVCALTGKNPRIVPLNRPLSYLQALLLELLPGKLMTRDNFHSLLTDNTCDCEFPPVLGPPPLAMEAVVPRYLAAARARPHHDVSRVQAD